MAGGTRKGRRGGTVIERLDGGDLGQLEFLDQAVPKGLEGALLRGQDGRSLVASSGVMK